jgi:hypothetical protein
MTPEQRTLIEEMLREEFTNADISRATGVSDRRISEIRAKISVAEDGASGDVGKERELYGKKLRSAIPVSHRVGILKTLVKSKNPQVAIKALEMADRLSGYAKEDAALAPQTSPIFALPPGTKVKFSK